MASKTSAPSRSCFVFILIGLETVMVQDSEDLHFWFKTTYPIVFDLLTWE